MLGGITSAVLTLGCSASPTSPTDSTTTGGTGGTTGGACVVTPNEAVGPFPSLVDLFRSDIREGKSGTRLDLIITVVNTGPTVALWME